jgi:hypothetical protein
MLGHGEVDFNGTSVLGLIRILSDFPISTIPLYMLILLGTLPPILRATIRWLEMRRCHCNPVLPEQAIKYALLDTLAFGVDIYLMNLLHIKGFGLLTCISLIHGLGQFIYWVLSSIPFRFCMGQVYQRNRALKSIYKIDPEKLKVCNIQISVAGRSTPIKFILGMNSDQNLLGRSEYLKGLDTLHEPTKSDEKSDIALINFDFDQKGNFVSRKFVGWARSRLTDNWPTASYMGKSN